MKNTFGQVKPTTLFIKSTQAESAIDVTDEEVRSKLVHCLLLSCESDEIKDLPIKLGQSELLSNQAALSLWVCRETQNLNFKQPVKLFNFLAIKLQSVINCRGNK